MKLRYRVRGPFGDRGNPYRWTVVDTHDHDIAVDKSRRRSDAVDVARELNADPAKDGAGQSADRTA